MPEKPGGSIILKELPRAAARKKQAHKPRRDIKRRGERLNTTEYRCPHCHMRFGLMPDLDVHLFFGCDGRPLPQQPPAVYAGKRKGWTAQCARCGEAFDNKSDYNKHIKACKKRVATPDEELRNPGNPEKETAIIEVPEMETEGNLDEL